jgi:hypothetical protein
VTDDTPRYRVEIPFRAATNGRLTDPPYELPDGARVETQIHARDRPDEQQPVVSLSVTRTFGADGSPIESEATADRSDESLAGRYRYCATLRAANAEDALALAEADTKALLAVLAANQMAFQIGAPKDRYIARLDPPTDPVPDTELPFETVNMTNRDEEVLARRFDPTGQLRRAGKILTSTTEHVVRRPSISLESELYSGRHLWDDRIPRAAEIYRLAQCSEDATVRFLLSCLAFEVLVAHEAKPILRAHLPTKTERAHVMNLVDDAFAAAGLPEDARKRITERIRTAEAKSYTASAAAYIDSLGLAIPAENLAWVQRQRGGFVHAGALEESDAAAERRNDFTKVVGVALLREMARLIGRPIEDLKPATSFSWLQVWEPDDDGEPTLIVG